MFALGRRLVTFEELERSRAPYPKHELDPVERRGCPADPMGTVMRRGNVPSAQSGPNGVGESFDHCGMERNAPPFRLIFAVSASESPRHNRECPATPAPHAPFVQLTTAAPVPVALKDFAAIPPVSVYVKVFAVVRPSSSLASLETVVEPE